MANKFQGANRKTAMDVTENNVTFVASFSSIYLHASRMASCSQKQPQKQLDFEDYTENNYLGRVEQKPHQIAETMPL